MMSGGPFQHCFSEMPNMGLGLVLGGGTQLWHQQYMSSHRNYPRTLR